MPIRINGNAYLVPAPLVSRNISVNKAPNGQVLNTVTNYTLNGYILPNKGNPVYSGSPEAVFMSGAWVNSYTPDDDPVTNNSIENLLVSHMRKQDQIRSVFVQKTGVVVELIGWNQVSGITFTADVESIEFSQEGRWSMPCPYTITLRSNSFLGESGNPYVSDIQETWGIQESDQVTVNTGDITNITKVYSISHNVSAVGLPIYDTNGGYLNGIHPWQRASGYVQSTLGIGPNGLPTGLINPFGLSYAVADRTIEESIDEIGGSYGINESFILYDSGAMPTGRSAIETIAISKDTGEDGITTINFQGTIVGLQTSPPTGVNRNVDYRYLNASGYYESIKNISYERVRRATNTPWIHPLPLNTVVSMSPSQGEISYTFVYNNRPPNIVSGSISENINITDIYPSQNIAIIPAIGRNQPILQYLNSRNEYRRSLNIEVQMGPITPNWGTIGPDGVWTTATPSGIRNWLIGQKPSVTQTAAFSGIYSAANPAESVPGVVVGKTFYTDVNESFNPRTGAYSYNIEWVYQKSG